MPRGRPFKYPYEGCGSTNTVSKGARITKSMGVRKFTPRNQKPVQVEDDIQTEATSVTESEDPVTADIIEPELTEMQIPEP